MRIPLISLFLLLLGLSSMPGVAAEPHSFYYPQISHPELKVTASEVFNLYEADTQLEDSFYPTSRSNVWSRISDLELVTFFESQLIGATRHQDMFGKASLNLLPTLHGVGIEFKFSLNFR